MTMALLHIENLHTYYGSVRALKGINLEVKAGEVHATLQVEGFDSARDELIARFS